MRLDKYLAQADVGTRSEVKKMIRCGRVLLNGVPAKKPEQKITKEDIIIADGKEIHFSQYRYFMLNKPAGVVSATMDKNDTTVVELIDDAHSKNLFPVGRLDKDTEGLLLMTNDGALAHELLSPRKHVEKTYFVRVHGKVTEEDSAQFAQGMDIGDEKLTKPARVGKPVVYLKRIAMGSLRLDETLTPGAYRELTEEEIFSLKNRNN